MIFVIVLAILFFLAVYSPYLFLFYLSWKPLQFPFLFSIFWRMFEYFLLSIFLSQILGTLQDSLIYFTLFIPTALYIGFSTVAYLQVKRTPRFHYQGLNQPALSSLEASIENMVADGWQYPAKSTITHGLSYQSSYYYHLQNDPFLFITTHHENLNNLQVTLQFKPSQDCPHYLIAKMVSDLNKDYLRFVKKNANFHDHTILFWILFFGVITAYFLMFILKKYIAQFPLSDGTRLTIYISLLLVTLSIALDDLIATKPSKKI